MLPFFGRWRKPKCGRILVEADEETGLVRVNVDWPARKSPGERAELADGLAATLAALQNGKLLHQVQAAVALSGQNDPLGPGLSNSILTGLSKRMASLHNHASPDRPVVEADKALSL